MFGLMTHKASDDTFIDADGWRKVAMCPEVAFVVEASVV
jgi:hypothetical protein